MANELWFKGKQYSGVGKSTEGVSYTIDDQTYTGGAGAEIFNDYTGNKAVGAYSHAEGWGTIASGEYSHAEGLSNSATATGAHAEGYNNTASAQYSHVEGLNNEATKQEAHAEGYTTKATKDYAHSEGAYTIASGQASHAEGYEAEAQGKHSHAEGYHTVAKDYGHAENYRTEASFEAHAEGYITKAIGDYSHAEGGETISKGTGSHAEGLRTKSLESGSHAEGQSSETILIITLTSTDDEKIYTFSAAPWVSVEYGDVISNQDDRSGVLAIIIAVNGNKISLDRTLGTLDNVEYYLYQCGAMGPASHSEGQDCKAIGPYAHAEGYRTTATGHSSHTSGQNTIAKGETQYVIGKYNIPDENDTYAFIIGNGTSSSRSNAFAVDWDGKIYGATSGSILVNQGASISMNAMSKIETTNGFSFSGTNGGEITLGKGASNKSIYLNAEGNTLALNSNTNVNLSAASITMASGGNITMNNGGALNITQSSNLSMINGAAIETKNSSLKLGTKLFAYGEDEDITIIANSCNQVSQGQSMCGRSKIEMGGNINLISYSPRPGQTIDEEDEDAVYAQLFLTSETKLTTSYDVNLDKHLLNITLDNTTVSFTITELQALKALINNT